MARFPLRVRVRPGAARACDRGAAFVSDTHPQWSGRSARQRFGRPGLRNWSEPMNAYDVLFEHHKVLRGLCEKITELPPASDERRRALDELLMELHIHMRIEDDLFYPAV